jgi:hypothetical protein
MWQRLGITTVALTVFISPAISTAQGQPAAVPQPANHVPSEPPPSTVLRPALSQVQSTTANLDIQRWKTPREIRAQVQDNVGSIQQDLTQTLPGLLSAADAAPGSVPSSFAVYRNVDALYDVLLRVSEVANYAAPRDEAYTIASTLQQLEAARAHLGDAILRVSQQHETQIKEFEAVIRAAKAAQAAPPRESIVDDGPVARSSTTRRHTERKTTHRKHEKKTESGAPK